MHLFKRKLSRNELFRVEPNTTGSQKNENFKFFNFQNSTGTLEK